MLPSASLNSKNKGMYEPVHGSAPDISGKQLANPLAAILSIAMMLKYSFGLDEASLSIENAIEEVLSEGYRTNDLEGLEENILSTSEMGNKIVEHLK
jgi:3-isopropylmalate dehydrogenase